MATSLPVSPFPMGTSGSTPPARSRPAVTPQLSSLNVPSGGAGSTLYRADVLLDLPHPQMISSGETAASALEMAEFSMACINTNYLRDAAIINRIGLVIIRPLTHDSIT